jgi:hypothetical protein
MRAEHTINPQRTPTAPTVPFVGDVEALRAQLRAEVLAEIEVAAATALLEVERASRETARIKTCEEYAAPRFIQRRLNETRQHLLAILSVAAAPTEPDDNPPLAAASSGSGGGAQASQYSYTLQGIVGGLDVSEPVEGVVEVCEDCQPCPNCGGMELSDDCRDHKAEECGAHVPPTITGDRDAASDNKGVSA